jgi:transposase
MNIKKSNERSARVTQPERRQIEMRFHSLDQMLYHDHLARVVWRFVETLDLTPLYAEIEVSSTQAGRSATNPKVLLSLWLLATLEGIGSARELGRRCERDIPYMWLCGGIGINYHTLSDFRVGHGEFLEQLLTDGVTCLIDRGLVPLETIAQDGMRVKASAGTSSFRREPTLKKLRDQAAKARRVTKPAKPVAKELETEPPANVSSGSTKRLRRSKSFKQNARSEKKEQAKKPVAARQIPSLGG